MKKFITLGSDKFGGGIRRRPDFPLYRFVIFPLVRCKINSLRLFTPLLCVVTLNADVCQKLLDFIIHLLGTASPILTRGSTMKYTSFSLLHDSLVREM